MNQFNAVHQQLTRYFDFLYFCDVDKIDDIFHGNAIYATADESPLLYRDMETYAEVIAKRQSPASRQEARKDRVDGIEFAGENTAFARVRCSIGDKDFVDFLTLVRVDNEWKIMAKVFHIAQTE